MRGGICRSSAGLVSGLLLALVGLVLVASPSGAAPSATGSANRFAFTGYAFGSKVTLPNHVVYSGPSAPVTLGCTDRGGIHRTNTIASLNLAPLITEGTVSTTATTTLGANLAQSQTSATTTGLDLLQGAVTASAVQAVSTTTHDGSGFHLSAQGSSLLNLVVAGHPVSANPPPNTTISLPGLGTIVLNQQRSMVAATSASLRVTMVHVTLTVANPIAPVGTQVLISDATSGLEGPVVGVVDGHAYGSSLTVGSTVESGPSAEVFLPCLGTDGAILTNQAAEVTLPGVADLGTVTNTTTGTVNGSAANSESTSTIQSANILSGVVTATLIKADAVASEGPGGPSFGSGGSMIGAISVNGVPIAGPIPPNTQINLPGVGTLYLYRVLQTGHHIEVRMLELVSGPTDQVPNIDLRIAVAEASVE